MYSHPFAAAARGRLSLDLHCTHTADVRTDRGPRVCCHGGGRASPRDRECDASTDGTACTRARPQAHRSSARSGSSSARVPASGDTATSSETCQRSDPGRSTTAESADRAWPDAGGAARSSAAAGRTGAHSRQPVYARAHRGCPTEPRAEVRRRPSSAWAASKAVQPCNGSSARRGQARAASTAVAPRPHVPQQHVARTCCRYAHGR